MTACSFDLASSHQIDPRAIRARIKDMIPMATRRKLTCHPWPMPILQRASARRMLVNECTKKKKSMYRSSSVCRYLASCRERRTRLYQAYPDTMKMIMNMRSIHAEMRLILTRILPAFKSIHPILHGIAWLSINGMYEKLIK